MKYFAVCLGQKDGLTASFSAPGTHKEAIDWATNQLSSKPNILKVGIVTMTEFVQRTSPAVEVVQFCETEATPIAPVKSFFGPKQSPEAPKPNGYEANEAAILAS